MNDASPPPIHKPQTAREAICAAGMNWKFAKVAKDSRRASDPQNKSLLVRRDLWDATCNNQAPEGVFGEVGNEYVILQPTDAFEFFDPVIATGGLYYDSAGFSSSGKEIWLTACLPGEVEIAPGDKVACFVKLSHSYDCSDYFKGPRISFCPVRVLSGIVIDGYFSGRELLSIDKPENRIIPVLRTPNGRPSLGENAETILYSIQQQYARVLRFFHDMARVKMDEQRRHEFVEGLFLQPLNVGNDKEYEKRLAERREQTRHWSQFVIERDRSETQETLWNVYNLVVEYNAFCVAKQAQQSATARPRRISTFILFVGAASQCYPRGEGYPFSSTSIKKLLSSTGCSRQRR